MDIDYIHINSLKTNFGKRVFKELSKLPWNSPASKQLETKGIYVSSNLGLIRNRNEDRFAVCEISSEEAVKFFLAVVCDGVGSTQNGDVAATLAVASLAEELVTCSSNFSLSKIAEEIVLKTDYKIREALKGSGLTTLSLIISRYGSSEIVIANVGDSRVYSWEPAADYVKQISIDDTLENELRGAGLENASVLDARGLRGALSQAVGDVDRGKDSLSVNIYPLHNDGVNGAVLATDGAWKSDELGFRKILGNASSAVDAVRRVTAFSSWIGGVDNTSIIAIESFDFLLGSDWRIGSSLDDLALATIWSHDSKLILPYIPDNTKKKRTYDSPKGRASKLPKKSQSKSQSPKNQLELGADINTSSKSNITELQITTKE